MTKREMLGMGSVAVVAAALAGKIAWSSHAARAGDPPAGKFAVQHTDAQWRALLPPASYNILRQAGTEKPFSSPLLNEHRAGTFACLGCSNKAYRSEKKYDSHTGWPSFWDTIPAAIVKRPDYTLGRSRTEVLCSRCGSHLGHVFGDGPQPTGLRYCMNGLALSFTPDVA